MGWFNAVDDFVCRLSKAIPVLYIPFECKHSQEVHLRGVLLCGRENKRICFSQYQNYILIFIKGQIKITFDYIQFKIPMENSKSSLNSVKPFFVDRKYRPPIPHHSKFKSSPISPIKHYTPLHNLNSILSPIINQNHLQASKVRNELSELQISQRHTTMEKRQESAIKNRKMKEVTRQRIMEAIDRVLKRNHQIYTELRHICQKRLELVNKCRAISTEKKEQNEASEKDGFSELINEALNQIYDQLKVDKENNEDDKLPKRAFKQKKKMKTYFINRKSVEEVKDFSDKSKKDMMQQNSNYRTRKVNSMKKSRFLSQAEFDKEDNSQFQIQIKNKLDKFIYRKKFSSKKKSSVLSNFFREEKEQEKRGRKSGTVERKKRKIRLKQKKNSQTSEKGEKKSGSLPRQGKRQKKKGLVRTIPEKQTKNLTILNKMIKETEEEAEENEYKIRKKGMKTARSIVSLKKESFDYFQKQLKQVSSEEEKEIRISLQTHTNKENQKKRSSSFMTKYEEHRLLFDIIRKKKNISTKKSKLKRETSDEDENDLKNSTNSIKEDKKTNQKKLQKVFLRKKQSFFQEIQVQLEQDSLKELNSSHHSVKQESSLWDDLLYKIMTKKHTSNLFQLKDNIEQKLKLCSNRKVKDLHNFNNYLKVALKAKLQKISETWLGNYKENDENEEIERLVSKLPLKVEEFEKPFVLEKLVKSQICNYYTGRIKNLNIIMDPIAQQQKENELSQISLSNISP